MANTCYNSGYNTVSNGSLNVYLARTNERTERRNNYRLRSKLSRRYAQARIPIRQWFDDETAALRAGRTAHAPSATVATATDTTGGAR